MGDAASYLVELVDATDIVTLADEQVWHRYGRTFAFLAKRGPVVAVPATERLKTLGGARMVRGACRTANPRATIIALGGGCVGDVVGWIAADPGHPRQFVEVPTTLVAQLDSAISGQRYLNAGRKNAYCRSSRPAIVVIDPAFCGSLLPEHLSSGLIEATKHGLFRSRALLGTVAQVARGPLNRQALAAIIHYVVSIKLEYIGSGGRLSCDRWELHAGHVLGHAIEHLLAGEMPHGWCVAVGLLAEGHAGWSLGVCERESLDTIEEALSVFAPPPKPSLPSADAIVAQALLQARREGRRSELTLALLSRSFVPCRSSMAVTHDLVEALTRGVGYGVRTIWPSEV